MQFWNKKTSSVVMDLDQTHALLLQHPQAIKDKSLLVPEGMDYKMAKTQRNFNNTSVNSIKDKHSKSFDYDLFSEDYRPST